MYGQTGLKLLPMGLLHTYLMKLQNRPGVIISPIENCGDGEIHNLSCILILCLHGETSSVTEEDMILTI